MYIQFRTQDSYLLRLFRPEHEEKEMSGLSAKVLEMSDLLTLRLKRCAKEVERSGLSHCI